MHEKSGKFLPMLVILTLLISVFTGVSVLGPVIVLADPGDVSDSFYNDTTLNVTVLQIQPRILWYDLQNASQVSMLNDQLDVNQEYYFKVNISSDQGWDNITYVNITCWYDLGNDANTYNQTKGGNINMHLVYDNTSGSASWSMAWPDDEATLGSCSEVNVTGSDGSPGYTETYNLTFAWTPGYQFRYTPDPSDATAGFNDTWSWNFNITATNDAGNYSWQNPIVGETIDEFGVYSYTEIVSAGWPVVVGNPGDNPAYNESYINIVTRSNGNYSLGVNVTNLTHKDNPSYTIQNTSIWTAGGELSPLTQFSGSHQYYYGGASSYTAALGNDTGLTTSDAEWGVTIAIGQQPGDYNATIYYHLMTQTF